ncbi:MAG: hypothetical protein ACKPKO_50480, partial [Candidatus Fonsibacter sp.]
MFDQYMEGQEDEGEPIGWKSLIDSEDASSDEVVVDNALGCAGGTNAPEADARKVEEGVLLDGNRQVRDIIEQARGVANPHVVMNLMRAEHTMKHKLSGVRSTDGDVASAAQANP